MFNRHRCTTCTDVSIIVLATIVLWNHRTVDVYKRQMYERGADEDQVGAILGIGERSAVRELLPRPKPTLAELLDELI